MSVKKSLSMLSHVAEQAVSLLLPPRCAVTGQIVEKQGTLAPEAWQHLAFISRPHCDCCGLPFDLDVDETARCGACLEHQPLFTKARAAVVYNDASRQLLLAFKYGDKLQHLHTFLPWLNRAGADVINSADIIIPVPLHRKRLWQRRFNQSAIIAAALARHHKKPWRHDILTRPVATQPQKGLSRTERAQNVRHAFAVPPLAAQLITGKTVLLIDDVYTSGATLNACARSLLDAGAETVNVLCIARVTREDFHA